MNKDQKSDSLPGPMPAPQLPNIPISPDDPFQPNPEQFPLVTPPTDPSPDPAPRRQSPGRAPAPSPNRHDPDDPEVV